MKTSKFQLKFTRGFTLIELLIIISIILILAALLFPVGAKIMQNVAMKRAYTELQQVAMAIENYKAKLGTYPPDTVDSNGNSTLYNELVGQGVVNSASGGTGDDAIPAHKFLKDLKPSQYSTGSSRVLGVAVDGPKMVGGINPYRYDASNPPRNVNSFDLWVDIVFGNKTNRISNWSPTPQAL